jgi:DNA-binding HxlR family transcriptional regulator
MLERTYEGQVCSVARTLEVIGERWTILIIRDAIRGKRRFDEFQASLGVARNILTVRLSRLCEAGILERQLYQEHPERYEYVLTAAGRELWPVLVALMGWGDRHLATQGPPLLLRHRGCGGLASAAVVCDTCGTQLELTDVEQAPGPGSRQPHRS